MRVPFLKDELITEKADELLNDYRPFEGSYEVDVVNIASKELDLDTHFADLQGEYGEGTLGMIVPSIRAILCDASLEPYGAAKENRERIMRFTIAHEIGHYMLHRSYMNNNESLFYQNIEKAEHKRLETQANMFAARLIMPATTFRPLYEYQRGRGACQISEIPHVMADAFNVSKDAAWNRSKALKYVS